MPKTPKKGRRKRSESAIGGSPLLEMAQGIMRSGLEAMSEAIDELRAGGGGKGRHDPASRIAYLTKKTAEIADAARKIDASDARRTAKLSKATVLYWIRMQDPTLRAAIRREIEAMDSGESVLS